MSKSRPLLEAPELGGREYARAHSQATDEWFHNLASERIGDPDQMALLAVGGYGRGELSPYSDIDLVLVHTDKADGGDLAEALWYPAWDRGLNLGYVVVTVKQAKTLLAEEFEWATAFLNTRLIFGNPKLHSKIDELTAKQWSKRSGQLMQQLFTSVEDRHQQRGDAASQIEPNIKEGRGGLRDVHALGWASRAVPGFASEFLEDLEPDVGLLTRARVELHRQSGRANDTLTLDDQDTVAEALGYDNSGQLMLSLARAARRIAWYSDEAWSRWAEARPMVGVEDLPEVEREDPLLPLRLAAHAARHDAVIRRTDLAALAEKWQGIPTPWPPVARHLLAELFLSGRPAIRVIEDLDHFGLMVRLLPEWANVQCRPQRNVLHTFTVDRHLCEAAVNAAHIANTTDWDHPPGSGRADLLVIGALFHDIGKGYPGDHTEVGQEVIAELADRMGYSPEERAVLVDLCRHHLLLPDIATRRDLSDPGTIRSVAAAVGSVEFLNLLAALTEADSIATGPSAWGSWKAGLLRELVDRTAGVLAGAHPEEVAVDSFPTDRIVELMQAGERYISGDGTKLTVVAHDRTGLFCSLAGALTTSGLEIIDCLSYSNSSADNRNESSMAAYELTVQVPRSQHIDWESVTEVVHKALDGRIALRARVMRRARDHARFRRRLSATPPRRAVLVDNEISESATVVEVHAPDHLGLLFQITEVLQELQLDITTAKIQTFGPQVVDSFYLTDASGAKLHDDELMRELELAINEVITQNGDDGPSPRGSSPQTAGYQVSI